MAEGIIFDIKKFALHDGQGIRTTVFLKGCPLDCTWCHNPESRLMEPVTYAHHRNCSAFKKEIQIGYKISAENVLQEILKDKIFYDESGGGATFSGGEPMHQIEFLAELLRLCKQSSLHTTVDTSGYVEFSRFEKILPLVDTFLFDIKIVDTDEHLKYTSVSNELILSNLSRLAKTHNDIHIRLPLVKGITDTKSNLSAVIDFLKRNPNLTKVDLLPYNKFGEDKIDRYRLERKKIKRDVQTESQLKEIQQLFESNQLQVQIGG